VGGCVCPVDFLGRILGRASRAGLCGPIMGSSSSCPDWGRPHSHASLPYRERTFSTVETCNGSACRGHPLSILRCSVVDDQFSMFLSRLRRSQTLSTRSTMLQSIASFSDSAQELISVRANSEFRSHTIRFLTGRRFRESTRIARAVCRLCQTFRELFRRG